MSATMNESSDGVEDIDDAAKRQGLGRAVAPRGIQGTDGGVADDARGRDTSAVPRDDTSRRDGRQQHHTEQGDDELTRFRREWEEEVRHRKHPDGASSAGQEEAASQSRDGSSVPRALLTTQLMQRQEQRRLDEDKLRQSLSGAQSYNGGQSDWATVPTAPSARQMMRPVSASDYAKRRPLLGAAMSSATSEATANQGTSESSSAATDGVASAAETGNDSEIGASEALGAPIRLMRRAVVAYSLAVASERKGHLDEALHHYRKAFKLDADADSLFDRASKALQTELEAQEGASDGRALRRDILIENDEVRQSICSALDADDYRYTAMQKEKERMAKQQTHARDRNAIESDAASQALSGMPQGQGDDAVTFTPAHSVPKESPRRVGRNGDQLARLIQGLSLDSGGQRNFSQTAFVPADEESPVHMAKLPDEVLLLILTHIAAPRGIRGDEVRRLHSAPSVNTQAQGHAKAQQHGQDRHERQFDNSSIPTGSTHAPKQQGQPTGIGVVLAGPDYVSIEQLARSCWKFRLLTRAWSVWKLIVNETYYPPQVSPHTELPTLFRQHGDDWRTTFVDQPRVRLNGAYIAAHHYTRPGVHEENVWVRVVHVVEFYRTLRFLPDGRLLSLLTTDPPSETVRRMEPSLRIKGFAIGHWKLYAEGLDDDDAYGRPPGPKIVIDDLHDKTLAGYSFRLVLKLDKTGRGKWNRMEMLEFESVNLRTGEVCPLPMNHKKPFHFSLVRSYGI